MKKIIDKISAPVIGNFISFVWLFLLILIPSLVYWLQMPSDILHFKYLILSLPVCFWSAYICSVVLYIFKKNCIQWIIYAILIIATSIESFLLIFFGTPITEMIIQLLLGTNSNEVSGFIKSFIFTIDFLQYVLCVLAVLLAIVLSNKFLRCIKVQGGFVKVFITLVICFCCMLNIWRDLRFVNIIQSDDVQAIRINRENKNYSKNYTTFGRLAWSLVIIDNLFDDISRLETSLSKVLLSKPVQNESKKIIVIIGESFNKYHSSLYGYELDTSPLLEKERCNGNLYVFTDVITPFNATYRSLKSFLSFESQDNYLRWTEHPLFPAIFKSSGYNVSFISNQEVASDANNVWDLYNNYLVNDRIWPYLFDYINERKYEYDGDLVQENVAPVQNSLASNQLVIYHLIGQHMDYASRYPAEYNIFQESDYLCRYDLNDYSKAIVAAYDNSILYNDKVITDILDIYRNEKSIILYFSDHGEEVYDYRDRAGRCHEEQITPERAKYEYSIPFMIWMSDKYKESYPNIVEAIQKSIANPFMIDDLPHLLMDLGGIEYKAYEPSRSVINEMYNKKRERLLELTKQNYEDIVQKDND